MKTVFLLYFYCIDTNLQPTGTNPQARIVLQLISGSTLPTHHWRTVEPLASATQECGRELGCIATLVPGRVPLQPCPFLQRDGGHPSCWPVQTHNGLGLLPSAQPLSHTLLITHGFRHLGRGLEVAQPQQIYSPVSGLHIHWDDAKVKLLRSSLQGQSGLWRR